MRALRTTYLSAAVAFIAVVGLSSPAHAETFSTGHFDLLDIDYDGTGAPTLNIKQYSPVDDNVSPVDNVIQVLPAAQATLGANLACIGAATEQVYRLPQSLNAGLIHAGWNTEGSTTAATLELVSASTPEGGKFAIYQAGLGSVSIKLANDSTTCGVSSFSMRANQHAHGNWIFTKAGTYELTFKVTTGAVDSGNVTYTFSVG